ncbi:hypothetical protein BpHYR1_047820 [Brachionus plicatilis]|uniref:Uncharacterized protein n=1 Tax=Brachionus plicatilis TaxID=10195 RepID=A0A3M7RT18_BRAPC|nr:hypothetical protein BpHYR1_047820 [Brachionus plicatilis]
MYRCSMMFNITEVENKKKTVFAIQPNPPKSILKLMLLSFKLNIVRHIIETSSRVLAVGIVAKFSKELLVNLWIALIIKAVSGSRIRNSLIGCYT